MRNGGSSARPEVMSLRDAVALWLRAEYYVSRPWMHPRAPRDPAHRHVPVTESLIEAEAAVARAFLGHNKHPEHHLDLFAAKEAGAPMWQDDLVEMGVVKGAKKGIPEVPVVLAPARRRRVLDAPPAQPAPRRRRLLD